MQGVLSGDRVWQEVSKILQFGSAGVELLDYLGYLETLFPEVKNLQNVKNHGPWHEEGNPYVHTLMVMDRYLERGNDKLVLMALLLHDIGKIAPMPNRSTYPGAKWGIGKFHGHEEVSAEMTEKVMLRLIGKELSRKDADTIVWLVAQHMRGGKVKGGKRNAMFADPRFPMLLEVLRADQLGRFPMSFDWQKTEVDFLNFNQVFSPENDGPTLKKLGVNGHTVMQAFSLNPGPVLGALLVQAQEFLWENPEASQEAVMAFLADSLNPGH